MIQCGLPPDCRSRQRRIRDRGRSGYRSPFVQLSGGEMKNPLDSLWGTVITGLVVTIVLYWIAKTVMGS
jgi:hypothetical protein